MISWRNTGAVKDSTRSASCGNDQYTRALSVLGPCPKQKLSLAFPYPKAQGSWVKTHLGLKCPRVRGQRAPGSRRSKGFRGSKGLKGLSNFPALLIQRNQGFNLGLSCFKRTKDTRASEFARDRGLPPLYPTPLVALT